MDPLLAPVLRRDGRVKALFALAGQVRAPAGRGYAPIGLILCGEKNREQIELLQLDRGEIRVAEDLV